MYKEIINFITANRQKIIRIFWISVILLIIIAISYQFVKGWYTIKNYPWTWDFNNIFFSFLFYSLGLLATSSVWSSIISKISGTNNYFDNIRLYCITNLAQRIPTPFPYIGARTEAYVKFGIARNVTLTGLSIEITITILSGLILSLFTLPFGIIENLGTNFNIVLISIFIIPLIWFSIRPTSIIKIINKVYKKFYNDELKINIKSQDMVRWLLYFIPIWINSGLIYFFITKSIYPFQFSNILYLLNAVAISGVISWLGQVFFLIPNFASKQLTIAYLLSFIIPWQVALVVAVAARLFVLVYEVFWVGIISIFSRDLLNQITNTEE